MICRSLYIYLLCLGLFSNGLYALDYSIDLKKEAIKYSGPYAYEIDYFADEDFLASQNEFKKIFDGIKKRELLVREIGNSAEYRVLERYYAYAFKQILDRKKLDKNQATTNFRLPSSVPKSCPQNKKMSFSLIPFKRGDLLANCKSLVDEGVSLGFKKISLFYPVHYSGGNSKDRYYMSEIPQYGKEYFYEIANNITKEELHACLKYIDHKKLDLNYIPHLESVKNVSGFDEKEWRNLSGIPIDDIYAQASFGQLIEILYEDKELFRKQRIQLTISGENDPMFLMFPEKSFRITQKIKNDFKILNISPQIVWNSNGDFIHGFDIPQVKKIMPNCDSIEELLLSMDGITPSIYGEHNHVAADLNKKVSVALTIKNYKERLKNKLSELCPNKKFISVDKMKIGFGEFALDLENTDHKYSDILVEINKGSSDFIGLNFWNIEKWNHIGLGAVNVSDKKRLNAILEIKDNCR